MAPITWSDDELRAYVARPWGSLFGTDDPSDDFMSAASSQLVPQIRARLLQSLGAPTAPAGIAFLAASTVRSLSRHERDWLLVCERPWDRLAELVEERLVRSHRRAVGKTATKTLDGIESASQRRSIER